MSKVLKEAFVRILEVETKVRLDIKYQIVFSSCFLIYGKNAMKIFYKSPFYDILVPTQWISASWTLAADLVFSSCVVSSKPLWGSRNHWKGWMRSQWRRGFIDVEASDDEDICVD